MEPKRKAPEKRGLGWIMNFILGNSVGSESSAYASNAMAKRRKKKESVKVVMFTRPMERGKQGSQLDESYKGLL
jgi:hypothetical protein